MSRESTLLPAPAAPYFISPNDRAYYKNTWGFDPVSDWVTERKYIFIIETWFPLAADPGISAAGVEIGARVTVNVLVGFILNDILFRCPRIIGKKSIFREAGVACIHTVVYTGSLDDALEVAGDMPDNLKYRAKHRVQRRFRVRLPPWEHFAALKSYVVAIAEAGIGNLLRMSRVRDPEVPEMLPFGFNAQMQSQIIKAIHHVSREAGHAILRDYLLELYDTAPREWFLSRLPILKRQFSFDKETLAEVSGRVIPPEERRSS